MTDLLEPTTTQSIVDEYKSHVWPAAATYYAEPLVIDHGDGMFVFDDKGNRYLDCFGGVLTVSVGHANKQVNHAIIDQVAKVSHTSTLYVNKPATQLASKVADVTPGKLNTSFFTNSGTEADETAMILARLYTGRQEIIALRHGYSGRSMLAQSLTAHAKYRAVPSQIAAIKHAHAPYCYRCPFGATPDKCGLECAQDIEELIQTTTTGQIAGFLAATASGQSKPQCAKCGGSAPGFPVEAGWARARGELRLGKILRVLGGHKGMAEHRRDERGIA